MNFYFGCFVATLLEMMSRLLRFARNDKDYFPERVGGLKPTAIPIKKKQLSLRGA